MSRVRVPPLVPHPVLMRPILDGSTLHLHVQLRSRGTKPAFSSLAQPLKLAQFPTELGAVPPAGGRPKALVKSQKTRGGMRPGPQAPV